MCNRARPVHLPGYIQKNPVRKGYVARPKQGPWSSANPASQLLTKLLAATSVDGQSYALFEAVCVC